MFTNLKNIKIVFLSIAISLIITGCASGKLLKQSLTINVGNNKNQVQQILGGPQNRQFNGAREVWQYCETDYSGYKGDDYIVVWFDNNLVTGVTTYKNTAIGDCAMFFRSVQW